MSNAESGQNFWLRAKEMFVVSTGLKHFYRCAVLPCLTAVGIDEIQNAEGIVSRLTSAFYLFGLKCVWSARQFVR